MDIQVSYDSSTASAPSWYKSAVAYVVSQYDALITNPITVKINMGWGEENGNAINPGAIADNQSNATYMSYGDLTKAMAGSASSLADQTAAANLSSTDPTNGGKFYVPLALQKALGVQNTPTGYVDGYVGLSSSVAYTYSSTGQIAAGTYDVISVLEHEISEVLGRVSFAGQGSATGTYTPLDLFRYGAPGQRSLTAGSGNFSIDGQNMLESYGNSGDAADWNPNIVGDVFDNVTAGVASHFSSADFTMLDVLGYTLNSQATDAMSSTSSSSSAGLSSSGSHTISPAYDAAVEGSSCSDTFVFRPHPGQVTVTDFLTSGLKHDTLSFSQTNFSSLADLLQHTTMSNGNAIIHVSKTDTVELFGVTKAQMRAHPGDFTFHA